MLLLRAGARRAGAAAAGGRPAHQSPTHLAARPRCAAVAHGRCFSAGRAHGPSPAAAAAAAAAPARRGLEPQRRRSPPLDAAEPAAIDTFCWQAARGLASALPPTPTAPRGAASATSTSAQAAAAAASLRDIDAWLGANGAGAWHGRVGESAAIVEGAEVTVGHVTVGQPPPPPPGGDGVARELGGDEQGPPAAEGEGMLMSSVLKKRRAKIKKHWCATAPLPPSDALATLLARRCRAVSVLRVPPALQNSTRSCQESLRWFTSLLLLLTVLSHPRLSRGAATLLVTLLLTAAGGRVGFCMRRLKKRRRRNRYKTKIGKGK
jgi:hypothetical protein